MAEKQKIRDPKKELIEGLKSDKVRVFTATVLFRDSPLKDRQMETTILPKFVVEALEKGKKLEDVRLYGADPPRGHTWPAFLKSCEEFGRGSISANLLVDAGGALKLSKELAEFMRLRIEMSGVSGV